MFYSYNPATGEIVWQGPSASLAEVDAAVQSAQHAFEGWSSLFVEERLHYLTRFSDILRQSQQALAETISKETGKPLWDSLNEVQSMINKIALTHEAYLQRCASLTREQPAARSLTRHRPHGVVAVLGPYNFPGHLPNGHIIPALLAGNTIVFKPSELTPLVAEQTMSYWEQTGLPKGVLNLVQGGRETGQAVIQHPGIQGVFFTGSYPTGRYLTQLFADQPSKILALELGGNNPLVIGTLDNLQAAAYITIQSAYLTSGQRCTCARRLIIPQTQQGDAFLAVLMEMIPHIVVGPYNQTPTPFMGPVISEKHALHLLEAQKNLQTKGGQPLIEMRHLKPGTGFVSPGLMDVTFIEDLPDEEIFGPFLQVIRVKDLPAAIDVANRTKFGLSAGLLSIRPEDYQFFYQHIQAGIVNWNTQLTGASSAAPFGGIKCSGNYRPSAYYAVDYCSYPVASMETPQLSMPSNLMPGIQLTQEKPS